MKYKKYRFNVFTKQNLPLIAGGTAAVGETDTEGAGETDTVTEVNI